MVYVAAPAPGVRKFMTQVYQCVKVYFVYIRYARVVYVW